MHMIEGHCQVRDGAKLFYRDVGAGPVIVMIPAWSMTADAFMHQIAHLRENYRVISLDPRGQGRSEKTVEGNDYTTHAHDLHDVLTQLGISRFCVLAWSNAVITAANYMRIYGHHCVTAFINVDMPPMATPVETDDWAEVETFPAFRHFLEPLTADADAFRASMVPFFVKRPLSIHENQWLLGQMAMQPPFVGRLLISDILFYSFADLVSELSLAIPTFVAVRQDWADIASTWVSRRWPYARSKCFAGGHMFFWEDPTPFNQELETFLSEAVERQR